MTEPDNERRAGKFPVETYHQSISVPFEFPVHFTRNLFDQGNSLFASVIERLHERRRHRAAFYIDSGVAESHPQLIRQIKEYFHARPNMMELAGSPELVHGGEGAKAGWDAVRDVMWAIGNMHLDRQSFVVAIGGGSVLDMVGFATSIVHRGLRLIRIPSTTLAQNDAGVGVKNAMNEHGMKNFVGTFAPPFAVIDDFALLHTLAQKDWIGGVAEAFKVAIIKDATFFEFLCENAAALRERDRGAMEETVRRCAVLHLDHTRTSGDPFEFGSARPLDFGHWAAHKLETMSGYSLGHGQAVSIGIAVDSHYAMARGLIASGDYERIVAGLAACGLPVWSELLEERSPDGVLLVLDGLRQFREHLGGTLTVTLPDGIGGKCEVHEMNVDMIEDAVADLKKRFPVSSDQ